MIKEFKGDLLKSGCDLICHQVNLQGVMGGGIALQIAREYPNVEKEYKRYLESVGKEQALYKIVNAYDKIDGQKILRFRVVNCFSQDEDFTTNYAKLRIIMKELKRQIKNEYRPYIVNDCVIRVGIPKNYGCGIANGDWNKVKQIFNDIFSKERNIDLQIWEYKNEIKNKI